jgi:hypothetical protein
MQNVVSFCRENENRKIPLVVFLLPFDDGHGRRDEK